MIPDDEARRSRNGAGGSSGSTSSVISGASLLRPVRLPPTPRSPLLPHTASASAAATAARLARRKLDLTLDDEGTEKTPEKTPVLDTPSSLWSTPSSPDRSSRNEEPVSPLARKYSVSLRRLADVERNLDASEDNVEKVTKELRTLKVRNPV